jgi:hypothetical protein
MRDDGFDLHTKNEQSGNLKQNYFGNEASGYDRLNLGSGADRVFRLDSVQKTQFERLFGADLEDVRIHLGPDANDITRKAHADAVTIGCDIYFHSGKFAPDTEEGRSLLAHELQHFIHFKEDKRMVYREDLEELEGEAIATEILMGGLAIQHVGKPHFADSGKGGAIGHNESDAENESAVRFDEAPHTLGEFSGKSRAPMFRIYFPRTGKEYVLTNEDKELALERAVVKYKKYLDDEASLLPEDERERFLLSHLSFLYHA